MKKVIDYKQILNYINLIGCILISIRTLFYNIEMPYLLNFGSLYLFFITWVIEFFVEKRWTNWRCDKTTIYFIVLISFFLLSLLYAPFDTTKYFKNLLEKRYALLGFGIVGLFGLNKKYKLSYFLNTIIITAIVAIVFLISKIGWSTFFLSPNRDVLLTQTRIAYISAHMGFNLYLNFALVGIWYICTHKWNQMATWKHYAYGFALIVIFGILSLSEGRSGFVASILLICSFTVFEIWKRRKILGLLIILLAPIALYEASAHHSRMSEEMLRNEPRLALWHSAVDLITKKPLTGYGMSRAQEMYDTVNYKYCSPEYTEYVTSNQPMFTDSHNQYIQTALEFGIIGLILLLFIYGAPIFICKKGRRAFAFFICALCAYQSLFDMFITGQFCTLFCLMMLILLRVDDDVIAKTNN
ncbi:MAG TPA: O-antigen ligase family protein [Paludibacteraceae bacterium]|jgi:O-antigen ligase|nr:MAG: O-Antigen ligase [Bacteroidetes bacterium ADurb.Bin057]HOH71459.1 O-antigen ligase family protein [Paludibacteraceae bacterium]HPO47788.1 O-antigen ligase family protein [Paludibacteraceae bacterium]HPW96423.1 O-antigen ligase family protein [Paludibacteraceae bacterium]HQC03919.1 O-antigen ligase family protein [Paludibacteraceae bacterium]